MQGYWKRDGLRGVGWERLEHPHPQASIPAINHAFYLEFDPTFVQNLLSIQTLPNWWKEQFAEKAHKQQHWSSELKDG
ncbi:MAG: hypothetical protein R2880_08215 [Deinococcales bacterium]